jgi:Trypsin-co-occurring domain 1
VSTPDDRISAARQFDVGVAIVPTAVGAPAPGTTDPEGGEGSVPGYEETLGRGRPHAADAVPFLIEKGEDAVRSATDALAGQIGLAAQRIAAAVGNQLTSPAGACDLESVSVVFGITLAAGVQAMFTAQAQSSVQVTITLSVRSADADPSAPRVSP